MPFPFAQEELPKKARVEIIPLIDVIFFLLATFVLFTLSLNKIQSIPLELPQVAPSQPVVKNDTELVVLQLSDTDAAFWNQESITFDEIRPRLINYKNTAKMPRVLISGDDAATYGAAIRALDEVRQSGINEVSIETAYRGSGQ